MTVVHWRENCTREHGLKQIQLAHVITWSISITDFDHQCMKCDKDTKDICVELQCLIVAVVQDYLFTYKKGIEGVTPQDVLAAASRHLHPSQHTVVMAADASLVGPQLEAKGRKVIPLSLE